jgi:hypothetical protein
VKNSCSRAQNRFINRLFSAICLLPGVTVALFYAHILHARLLLGHWPACNRLEPKAIQSAFYTLHEVAIVIGAALTSLSPVAWLLALPLVEPRLTLNALLIQLAVFLALLGVFFIALQLDPGGFVAWFLD